MSCALHAPLPPSLAPQWGNCSGAVVAKMSAPERVHQRTIEGTAAHWVASECLLRWKDLQGGAPLCSEWLGKTAPNGVVIDREMADGAQVYVADVLDTVQRFGAMQSLLVEHRVHMPQIHPDNWGTLDTALPLLDRKVVFIWDYKHGHRETLAYGNLQLIDYLAGLINELRINGRDDQQITFVIRIVHPYSYGSRGPISEWSGTLSDLRGYINRLQFMANEAMTNPKMTAGLWCRDCPAVGVCATARRSVYSLLDYANEPYAIDAMTDADLATERKIIANGMIIAKARAEAINDELYHRISQGSTGSNLAIETKPGRLKWSVPNETAIAFAQSFGINAARPGVCTPTQAKDEAPPEMRKAFAEAIKSVASRPAGSGQLIDADDTISARAFKKN